jgi:hypothetical protein
MDKVLIVSWGIYPTPTGSSVIVNNLAGALDKSKIVIIGEAFNSTDIDEFNPNLPKIYYVNPNINLWGRGQTHLRWFNLFMLVKKIIIVSKLEKVNKIVCVFPDDFYLIATFFAIKRLKIPFYLWIHNTYLENYSGYRKVIAFFMQPLVFKISSKIFVISDGLLNFYKKKYKNKEFAVLPHGFPLPNKLPQIVEKQLNKPNNIKFLFTGSLNESCRDATVRLISVILSNSNYEVHAFTGNPESEFRKHGIDSLNFIWHGFIALEKLYDILPNYDIMLLPHGFSGERTDIEFKTIFPTRTIPLLISGKPILAHSPKKVFLTDFLIKHDCAFVSDEPTELSINRALSQILNDSISVKNRVSNAKKIASIFDVQKVAESFIAGINLQ